MIKLSIKFCIIMCIYLKDFGVADLREQMVAITTKRLIQFGNNFQTCKSPYYTVGFSFEDETVLFHFHIPIPST